MAWKNIEDKRAHERAYSKIYRKRRKGGELFDYRRDWYLKNSYGISLDDYNKMLESQNNCCAICKTKHIDSKLFVDHDHETRLVRGLLCTKCNTAIAFFKEDWMLLVLAVGYLNKWGKVDVDKDYL